MKFLLPVSIMCSLLISPVYAGDRVSPTKNPNYVDDEDISTNGVYIDDVFDARGRTDFSDIDLENDGTADIETDKGADNGKNSRGAEVNN